MNPNKLRESYLNFFETRGHKRIHSAPLVPENDSSVLFTTAGMQPLARYLMRTAPRRPAVEEVVKYAINVLAH